MPATDVSKYPVVRPEEGADCAIICLSLYLGVPYDEVLREVAVHVPEQGRKGMFTRQIKKVAKVLGTTLVTKKAIDWDDDYGIVLVHDHVAVLRNGLVFDTDGSIWDAEAWKAKYKKNRYEGILVAEELLDKEEGAHAEST